MVEPADIDDDEEDEEDFDEDVGAFYLIQFGLCWELCLQCFALFYLSIYTLHFSQAHCSTCMYPQKDGVPQLDTS